MVVMAVRGCRQILEHFMIWNFGQMGFFGGVGCISQDHNTF